MCATYGRPSVMNLNEASGISKGTVERINESDDAMIDVQNLIMKKRKHIHTDKSNFSHRSTVSRWAQASIMLDETVDAVPHDSLRLQSESRQVASHSLRTCMTQIVTTVRTQFVPGKWVDRPKDNMLKPGALEILILAEDYWGCEVRPIDPRYLINFDDTGRHHASESWSALAATQILLATKSVMSYLVGRVVKMRMMVCRLQN